MLNTLTPTLIDLTVLANNRQSTTTMSYPSILLSMLMLPFIIVIVLDLYDRERICAYCFFLIIIIIVCLHFRKFISISKLNIQLSEGGLDPILTGLTPPYCYACPKPRPGFRTLYSVAIFFVFNGLRWEVVVRIFYTCEIVDYPWHCLKVLFVIKTVSLLLLHIKIKQLKVSLRQTSSQNPNEKHGLHNIKPEHITWQIISKVCQKITE